ncbi:MAG: hypothetical protein LUE93_08385 [Bacteroides sp.]|nr:hypothetical protein [Bacteroides sp.]
MTTDKIKELLEAYYCGESSEADEKELELFFRKENIPSGLEKEKELFLAIHDSFEEKLPEGLEDRLSALITNREIKEKNNRQKWLRITGVAAAVALVFSVAFTLQQKDPLFFNRKDTITMSMQDQQQIYEEVKFILCYVSEELNNGLQEIEKSREEIRTLPEIIRKEFNP